MLVSTNCLRQAYVHGDAQNRAIDHCMSESCQIFRNVVWQHVYGYLMVSLLRDGARNFCLGVEKSRGSGWLRGPHHPDKVPGSARLPVTTSATGQRWGSGPRDSLPKALPKGYKGIYIPKLPKLDLGLIADAEYVANLETCQYVVVNV